MAQAGNKDKAQAEISENKLAVTSQVRLGFASTYYTMAQALGLQKIQDYIMVCFKRFCVHSLRKNVWQPLKILQGSPSLSTSSAPIWLLGVQYKGKQEAEGGMDQAVIKYPCTPISG